MKIDNLTGLRAFAALWVVMLHVRYGDAALAFGPLAYTIKMGATGVTIFFALSGFIMAHVHQTDFDSRIGFGQYARFMWLRLARIYPVHLLLLLVYSLGWWGWSNFDNRTSFALNLGLLQSWGLFGINGVNWNQPSWSISSEWFCYLLFPLLAFGIGKFKRPGLAAGALGAAALGTYPWFAGLDLSLAFMASPVQTFLVFLVGYGLRLLADQIGGGNRIWTAVLYAAIGWLVACLTTKSLTPFNTVAMSGLLCISLYKAGPSAIFANAVSVYVGEISYSLYMSHIMTFQYLRMRAGSPMLPLWVELSAVILVAVILHHLVETPIRNVMRKVIPYRSAHSAALQGSST